MKLLKKITFGILIATAIYTIAYFLLNIYNIGIDPMQIYTQYTTYLIFVYTSIIILYICATIHTRIVTWTIALILLINFLRLVSFFTQDVLGINMIEFYALTALFLIALAITRIRYRIRFPLIGIVGAPFIIILLNHTLPLYADKPDFQGFYDSQIPTLHIQAADGRGTLKEAETKITLKGDKKEQIINLREAKDTTFSMADTQITFSSKIGIQNSYAYAIFPKGGIITIYPQSAIAIENTSIHVIQGKISLYTPQDQQGYFQITGDISKIITNNTGNIQGIIDQYSMQRNEYFTKQIGGEIMLNPTIDAFIGGYLSIANSANRIIENISNYFSLNLSIPSFDQNRLNYDEFHSYLKYKESAKYSAAETSGSTQRIARDTQKGREASNVKTRRDRTKNTIDSRMGK